MALGETIRVKSPEWVAILAAGLVALIAGFAAGEHLILGLAALALVLVVFGFLVVPYSFSVKLVFLIVAPPLLQRSVGYVRSGAVQGLNLGNVLLALAVCYWIYRWASTGRFYRPTPVDAWALATFVGFPLLSIYFTAAFRQVPGYTLVDELRFLKQYATPVFYFLLICQTLERRKEAVLLFYVVVGLAAFAVLGALPETLYLKSWHESRAEGFVAEANRFGAFISLVAPFLFIALLLAKGRPWLRGVVMAVLAGLAFSLLPTYSRSGYVGFALAFLGSIYLAYRATRRLPVGMPAVVLGVAALVAVSLEPRLFDYVRDRFEMETYQRAKRKSYTTYAKLNEYSGSRLDIWKVAVAMSRDHPIVGAGFDAFVNEFPKYNRRRSAQPPHNHYLGTLAQGGVVWVLLMAGYLYKLFRLLLQNWRVSLAERDVWGQIICGGGLISYVIMLWIGLTLDFYYPGPQILIFWILMAASVLYPSLEAEPEPAAEVAPVPPAAAPVAAAG